MHSYNNTSHRLHTDVQPYCNSEQGNTISTVSFPSTSQHPHTVRPQTHTPLIAGEVIVDAGLHVLEGVQCGKHVDEPGQGEQVGLRDKVLPLLGVGQRADLITEPGGGTEHEPHHLLGLVDLWTQDGDRLLVDLHPVGLILGLDLRRGVRE